MSNIVNQGLKVKYNNNRRDCVYTPEDLAINLIKKISIKKSDVLLDPAAGSGVFFRNFPKSKNKYSCEIEKGSDFFNFSKEVDWIITNPPYSTLNKYLEHSLKLSRKGVAFLVGSYSITSKRLEIIKKYGFTVSDLHFFKVSSWFGTQLFMILKRNKKGKANITYSRKVYQCPSHIKRTINQNTILNYQKGRDLH